MINPSPASNGNFAPPPGAESRAKRGVSRACIRGAPRGRRSKTPLPPSSSKSAGRAATRCENYAAMRRHRLIACGKRKREFVRFMANK